MIRLEGVTKYYGQTLAVDDLSLEIADGQICVLIGPSGCGKTTTLRMINRLIEPTRGRIVIDGKDARQMKPEQLRRSIGYAIQSVGLFPHMTVARNIAVVPELLHWNKERTAKRIEELLRLVGLEPAGHAGKYPNELSGGEAQRVGVARALAADPPVLLMDEPFGAVDPLTRERLQAQFSRIQQALKKTVILVTHDLDEAIRLADRIAIMQAGKLVQYDTPEAILSHPVNKFVHDFVGTDRALKRLSRLGVKNIIRSTARVTTNMTGAEAIAATTRQRWAWVVDMQGRLTGWIDTENMPGTGAIGEIMVRGDGGEIGITINATMREALSRMLGQGFKTIPVVDNEGCLVGEVTLRDVEDATIEAETQP